MDAERFDLSALCFKIMIVLSYLPIVLNLHKCGCQYADQNPIENIEGEAVCCEGENGQAPPYTEDFCDTANKGDDKSRELNKSFCELFSRLYENTPRRLLGEFDELIDYFADGADINGSSFVDKRIEGDENVKYQIGGNGMPDCACELKLIEIILQDNDFCIYNSGLSHKLVHDAWKRNKKQLSKDFGGYWDLAAAILPGFGDILCGYMIIGDGNIDYSIENYASGNGSVALVLGIAFILGDRIPNPRPNLGDYARLPELFAPDGDADGDGRTNREEYNTLGPEATSESYVTVALNPEL